MKEIIKTSRLAGQLEKLYNKINADFFNGELTAPIITIQSTPRAYGHYTMYDAWSVKGEGRREINIGAGTLDRPIENVVATLLHEMCHQYSNEVLNVQDCSNHGIYHNKWIIENEIQEIQLNRNEASGIRIAGGNAAASGGASTTGTTKGHYRRYVCPKCGMIARTTKDAHLICGDCLCPMI